MAYCGEITALATAFCWANTSLFFAAAGKRIGAVFTIEGISLLFLR
jgi:hypothetical protein